MASDSHLPPYARIAAEIKRRIARQEWIVGAALPPQRQLSVTFGVTTATLNRAIGMLVEEGVLTTSSGHGTFVARMPAASTAEAPARRASGRQAPPPGLEIALIAPGDHDPLSGSTSGETMTDVVAHAIEQAVTAAQGHLRFYRLWHGGLASVDDAIASACSQGTDGIIIVNITDYAKIDAASEPHLAAQRVPGILIPGGSNPFAIPQVTYGQEQAGFAAGDHLLAMGYRQLVAVRAVDAVWCDQRIAGVAAALRLRAPGGRSLEVIDMAVPLEKSHGISDAELAQLADGQLDRMRRSAWWDSGPVGVVLPADRFALALLGAMRRHGIAPGRQLGVLGFNDSGPARMAGLTSVRPPLESLGAFAAEAVLRSVGHAVPATLTVLPVTITARDSTRQS